MSTVPLTHAEPPSSATQPQPISPPAFGFHHILVPTDFSLPSLKALDYALALAAPANGEVPVIHAMEPSGEYRNYINYDAGRPMIPRPEEVELCREELQRVAEERRGASARISYRTAVGNPAIEIIDCTRDYPADLIVISSHGRTGLKHLLLGSVTERVIRAAPCPVLVLRRHEREFLGAVSPGEGAREPRRILVPIDFSPRSLSALRFAGRFAATFGGIVNVMYSLRPFVGFLSDELAYGAAAAEAEAIYLAEKALCDFVPKEVAGGVIVRTGPPLAEIPLAAEEGSFDLIVCASRSDKPIQHALLGSTAEGIVRHASCPVLVVNARAGAEVTR